jgi:hypothetical protein
MRRFLDQTFLTSCIGALSLHPRNATCDVMVHFACYDPRLVSMRFFFIRKAKIPKNERETFERYGPNVIGMILAAGFHPAAREIEKVYDAGPLQEHARDWMSEQFRRAERWESWSLLMEAAITVFVLTELLVTLLGRDRFLSIVRSLFRG